MDCFVAIRLPCANELMAKPDLSQHHDGFSQRVRVNATSSMPAPGYAKASPGFAGAVLADGTGLNVRAIRKAPRPMIHEPI